MMLVNPVQTYKRAFIMNLFISDFLGAAAIGLGATLIMDLWALFSHKYLGLTPPNYCLVGRWFRYMPDGKWRHYNIAKSQAKWGECAVGWLIHYGIGAVYGIALVALTSGDWRYHPNIWIALGFGVATLVFPFLVMQPSFGLGFFSARVANPLQARLKSLFAHAAFGGGLYISANLINVVTAVT